MNTYTIEFAGPRGGWLTIRADRFEQSGEDYKDWVIFRRDRENGVSYETYRVKATEVRSIRLIEEEDDDGCHHIDRG